MHRVKEQHPSTASVEAPYRTSSKRTKATIDAICFLIAEGSSLLQACKEIGYAPKNFRAWLADPTDPLSDYARTKYACARDEQADKFADEIVGISDAATVRDAHVARLRVDSRKWVASKLLPKKYGDRPNEINVNTQINLATLSLEDQQRLQARRQELLKEQGE